mgnify:CR=1 FL=1
MENDIKTIPVRITVEKPYGLKDVSMLLQNNWKKLGLEKVH